MSSNKNMTNAIIVAFATMKDEQILTNSHFGSADSYVLYKCNSLECKKLQTIKNTTAEERSHNDPGKASSVTELLKKYNVNVIVARRFGPNLKRVNKNFVPVIVKSESVDETLKTIHRHTEEIINQWITKPEQRTNILL